MRQASPTAAGSGRLDWRQVGILYRCEMRSALREKAIVLNSILIPLLLYPFLLWAAFSGILFVSGQTEGLLSRVLVPEWPKEHPGLRRLLERDEHVQLVEPQPGREAAAAQLRSGQLDALVEFEPATGDGAALPRNFNARISFNESKERSLGARDRVKSALEHYREDWLRREARARDIDAASWQVFTITSRDVASKREIGAFILGLTLPVMFVVMVAVGCVYPAIDALAGERERNTWETLMSTAATRTSIVTAKYLYVVSLGGLAGALNLLAIVLTLKPIFAPLLERVGKTIESGLPLAALPVAAVAGLLLAGFVAAGMMIFAAFARTFKEGQAMVTPFYLVVLMPVVFLQVPGLKLSPALACVPMVNLTLMVREAVTGTFHWGAIAIAVGSSLVLIALCLRLAAFILRFEDVMVGAYGGSLGRFLSERVFKKARPVPPAPHTLP